MKYRCNVGCINLWFSLQVELCGVRYFARSTLEHLCAVVVTLALTLASFCGGGPGFFTRTGNHAWVVFRVIRLNCNVTIWQFHELNPPPPPIPLTSTTINGCEDNLCSFFWLGTVVGFHADAGVCFVSCFWPVPYVLSTADPQGYIRWEV